MFKIFQEKKNNSKAFSLTGACQNDKEASNKVNRVWQNIEILKEIMKRDLKRASEFTGFGGVWKQLQDPKVQTELKNMLGDDLFLGLLKSTSTAYYTPKPIVKYCWQIAEQLGFRGGKVLESCCGNGAFLGAMPDHLRQKSKI